SNTVILRPTSPSPPSATMRTASRSIFGGRDSSWVNALFTEVTTPGQLGGDERHVLLICWEQRHAHIVVVEYSLGLQSGLRRDHARQVVHERIHHVPGLAGQGGRGGTDGGRHRPHRRGEGAT